MIATSHVIIGGAVGLAVGTVTKNPSAAFAAGIISHLICDAIPHLDGPLHPKATDRIVWTKGMYLFAITDSLLAFFLTLFIWYKFFDLSFYSVFAWGAFGGYLPDLIDNFPLWSQQIQTKPGFRQFHKLHLNIHKSWQLHFPMIDYWPLGVITQLIIALPCLWLISK